MSSDWMRISNQRLFPFVNLIIINLDNKWSVIYDSFENKYHKRHILIAPQRSLTFSSKNTYEKTHIFDRI